MSTVTQRLSVGYTGTPLLLKYYLSQLAGDVEQVETNEKKAFILFNSITVTMELRMAVVEVSVVPSKLPVSPSFIAKSPEILGKAFVENFNTKL